MLEDHGNSRPGLAQLLSGHGREISALDQHGSRRRSFQKIQTPDQCGFSCAAHTDNAVNITLSDIQSDSLQRFHLIILARKRFCHILNLNNRFHRLHLSDTGSSYYVDMNYCLYRSVSHIQASVNMGVERYLSPESGSSATIVFPLFSGRFAICAAA